MPDLEGLYREHRAGLVRLVERELRDRDEAEDVVQTAFVDAQRALTRGTIPHNPRAWLAAIALNAARRLRRRSLNAELLEEYAAQEVSHLPEIKAALAGLPRKEQAAVLYRDVLGLSYAEMAERMNTTVPAVTMLLHRARSRLRGLLAGVTVGAGVWRWLRGNAWQETAAKAAGVVVLSGLATAGVITSGRAVRATAPIAPSAVTVAPQAGATYAGIEKSIGDARRHTNRTDHRSPTIRPRADQSPAADAAPPAVAGATAAQPPSGAPDRSKAPPALPSLPSVPLPVSIPTLSPPGLPAPPTLPATIATVTTPMVTVTIAAPPSVTTTVATPVATVTVSVP